MSLKNILYACINVSTFFYSEAFVNHNCMKFKIVTIVIQFSLWNVYENFQIRVNLWKFIYSIWATENVMSKVNSFLTHKNFLDIEWNTGTELTMIISWCII